MGVFDLLFICLALTASVSLITGTFFAAGHQFERAGTVLQRLLAGSAAYMAVVIGVSLVLPRSVFHVGELQCFDDWCVSVADFHRTPEGTGAIYRVDLRLFSRARGVSQRENNLAVYLTDHRGRRFNPVTDKSAQPFSVLLEPQESAIVSRSFVIPADAGRPGLVITHEGGFPIGWFIIGYNTWFRKPPVAIFQ